MRTSCSFALLVALAFSQGCDDPPLVIETAVQQSGDQRIGSPEDGTGWILGRDGRPIFVQFQVIDGVAVYQGDMILGPVASIARSRAELTQSEIVAADAFECFPAGSGLCRTRRWQYGVVPYVISSQFNSSQQSSIIAGMRLIDSRASGVQFRPRSGSDTHWISFKPSSVCNSFVGRYGGGPLYSWSGGQDINLAPSCASSPGVVAHEALHALGAFHEQSRCDRDSFVQILTQNIESGEASNFDKECSGATDYGQYSESSVMHYGAYDFSGNGQPTIISLRGLPIGQRDSLADNDWQTLNMVYTPYPPMVTSLVEVDGSPYLTLSRPAGLQRYDVDLVLVWEEWDDYSGSFYTFDGSTSFVASVTTGAIHDTTNTYTGNSRCYEYQHTYGSGSWAYVYEITPWFQGGVMGTKLRWPAPVAPEYSPCA